MALASPAFINFLRFEVSCFIFCGVRVAPKNNNYFKFFISLPFSMNLTDL